MHPGDMKKTMDRVQQHYSHSGIRVDRNYFKHGTLSSGNATQKGNLKLFLDF